MKRLSPLKAKAKLLELELKRLRRLPKEHHVQILIAQEEDRIDRRSLADWHNKLAALTNGKFGCERPDLEEGGS